MSPGRDARHLLVTFFFAHAHSDGRPSGVSPLPEMLSCGQFLLSRRLGKSMIQAHCDLQGEPSVTVARELSFGGADAISPSTSAGHLFRGTVCRGWFPRDRGRGS